MTEKVTTDVEVQQPDVFGTREFYKPFTFPKYYEVYKVHRSMDWTPEEVVLDKDVLQWNTVLTHEERNFLTHIFRFFTQADVDVAGAYTKYHLPRFNLPEIKMMLLDFAQRETVHIDGYSLLIDTLGIPEATYSAFLEYSVMADKHDYLKKFEGDSVEDFIKQQFVFSGFTEGMQLFSSFIMLLSFRRFGKMIGMGTIVEWSIKDEQKHFEGNAMLFHDIVNQHPELWTPELIEELLQVAREMVALEDRFIDLAFELGGIEGLTPEEMKKYIRYIANARLKSLGLPEIFEDAEMLEWVNELLNLPVQANFFEVRVTEYTKSRNSSWSEFWAPIG